MLAKQIYEIALDNNPGTPRFHRTCNALVDVNIGTDAAKRDTGAKAAIDPPAIVTAKWASACQFTTAPAWLALSLPTTTRELSVWPRPADPPDSAGLLRARRERQCNRRTAEKGDEIAPF
jgi:hypothetical protein